MCIFENDILFKCKDECEENEQIYNGTESERRCEGDEPYCCV